MRVRDFDDLADEDYERMLGEQRDREERADRFADRGPQPLHWYWEAVGHQGKFLSRPQED